MIRIVAFLAILAAAAFGVSWLLDHPGQVSVLWLGERIEMSVFVALGLGLLVCLAFAILWSLFAFVFRVPGLLSFARHSRKHARGREAVSRGMIAAGAGDLGAARRASSEASRPPARRSARPAPARTGRADGRQPLRRRISLRGDVGAGFHASPRPARPSCRSAPSRRLRCRIPVGARSPHGRAAAMGGGRDRHAPRPSRRMGRCALRSSMRRDAPAPTALPRRDNGRCSRPPSRRTRSSSIRTAR